MDSLANELEKEQCNRGRVEDTSTIAFAQNHVIVDRCTNSVSQVDEQQSARKMTPAQSGFAVPKAQGERTQRTGQQQNRKGMKELAGD